VLLFFFFDSVLVFVLFVLFCLFCLLTFAFHFSPTRYLRNEVALTHHQWTCAQSQQTDEEMEDQLVDFQKNSDKQLLTLFQVSMLPTMFLPSCFSTLGFFGFHRLHARMIKISEPSRSSPSCPSPSHRMLLLPSLPSSTSHPFWTECMCCSRSSSLLPVSLLSFSCH